MAHKVFIAALEELLAQIPASSSAARSSWSQFWWQFQWLTAWTQHPNLGSEKRKSVRGGTWEKLLWERGRSSGGNHPQVNGSGAQEQQREQVVIVRENWFIHHSRPPGRLFYGAVLFLFLGLKHELRPFSVFPLLLSHIPVSCLPPLLSICHMQICSFEVRGKAELF